MTPRATPGAPRSRVSPAVNENLRGVRFLRRGSSGGSSGAKPAFTSRAAVLAVVLAALAIALAGPLRQWLGQRAQITALRDNVATSQRELKALRQQQMLWADPSYVAAQAQQRLHYVKPGEVPYITLAPTPSALASDAAAAAEANQPWYAQLWSSVQGAGATPRPVPSASASVAVPALPTYGPTAGG